MFALAIVAAGLAIIVAGAGQRDAVGYHLIGGFVLLVGLVRLVIAGAYHVGRGPSEGSMETDAPLVADDDGASSYAARNPNLVAPASGVLGFRRVNPHQAQRSDAG